MSTRGGRAAAGRGGDGLRLLVLSTEDITENRSGPEIRRLEMATAMARRHEVALASPHASARGQPGVEFLAAGRWGMLREAARRDAVIAPWIPAYMLAALARRPTLLVADLYDPMDLEAATLPAAPGARRWREIARLAHRNQLRFADLIVCASRRQRANLLRELSTADVARPVPPEVVVVPFGIGPEPPSPVGRPLRERFRAIGANDPVVLWWGSIWRWMDAPTAVRAVAALRESHPTIRLVLTAGVPPDERRQALSGAAGARELAAELGLLDRTVFFIDEWIPWDQRHEYLRDADVAVNLHHDAAEGALSARARYMDLLWASLPCVLSEGNEVARDFAEHGFAREVPVRDVARTAHAIADLLDGPTGVRARRAARSLADSYRWDRAVRPLESALTSAVEQGPREGGRPLAAAVSGLQYYRRRGEDVLAEGMSSSKALGNAARSWRG